MWHGNADILVDHSVVKVAEQTEAEAVSSETGYNSDTLEYQAGEPARKRIRTDHTGSDGKNAESSEDEEILSTAVDLSGNDYMPNGPNKISFTKCRPNETLSQVLAQTVVNAFSQVKKRKELQNYFIPSFLASDRYVTIHMYNPVDDVLLTQGQAMPLWQDTGELNRSNILCIWMALHMLDFSRCSPGQADQSNFYEKSNFHALVGNSLTEYKNNLAMPLGRQESDDVHYYTILLAKSFHYIIEERERLKRLKLEQNSRKSLSV